MNTVFQLSRVSKRYGSHKALSNVSLSGASGEVIALLGENGAGKTTAIKVLLGLVKPDSGSASVLQCDSLRQGLEIRRTLGYVPDKPSLYEWMTVAEIGWFASGFYPSGYLENYRDHVRRFDLPENRRIKSLSRGMQAKVALSLALSHEPRLLILDEPTSGLDPIVRREFLESMFDLASEGRTVLLSSHQIDEVERVADSVAVIRKGHLVAHERLDELKQQTREVVITLKYVEAAPPNPPGRVIFQQQFDRQWRIILSDFDAGHAEHIRSLHNVVEVEERTPSLEEIFVALMKSDTVGDVSQTRRLTNDTNQFEQVVEHQALDDASGKWEL